MLGTVEGAATLAVEIPNFSARRLCQVVVGYLAATNESLHLVVDLVHSMQMTMHGGFSAP